MKWRLSPALETCFRQELAAVCASSRLEETDRFLQHGTVSVYRHSVAVAYFSCLLAEKLHLRINRQALIRGALLHDYFLYDWHVKDPARRLHGFTHPALALRNAQNVFDLTPREQNMILRHMFPLTPVPPINREGWLVCLADKVCSLRETARLTNRFYGRIPDPRLQEAAG